MPVIPPDTAQIVVTASRVPERQSLTAASVTIIDSKLVDRLGEPLAADLLALVPSTGVAVSGPAGSLTEVRIRGAEANHTLLFIDGIRANDPATGDQPRFDLLNADIVSRIEVVRGPQSALWGSDAIGGVVAVNGVDPTTPAYSALVEAGSFGFRRVSGSGSMTSDRATLSMAAGWQRATGIDSFNGRGDRDGYSNFATRARGTLVLGPAVRLGASGFALKGKSEFDGFDPVTFLHADTLDNSRNRMAAGQVWADLGQAGGAWVGHLAASLLGSTNRNYLRNEFLNRTSGTRRTVGAQIDHHLKTGPVDHLFVAAAQAERETFRAEDVVYGGATAQDRTRRHNSLTAEWRGTARPLTADVAVRRDMFNRFRDTTSVRGSLLAELGSGLSVSAGYADGIAQPTFFDLYGFFPGSFVGNPTLRPESSRGVEVSLRYRASRFQAALTGYRQRLHDEIVDTYDPTTFLSSTRNRFETSHRSGIEAELQWTPSDALRVSATYSYLHATQPGDVPASQVREVRRPRNSGSISLDGTNGRLTYGAAVAYTGRRTDTDFDVYPSRPVSLHAYWLASARIGFRVSRNLELFARTENGLNAHYQDAFGYRTQGRGIYAGVRLAGG